MCGFVDVNVASEIPPTSIHGSRTHAFSSLFFDVIIVQRSLTGCEERAERAGEPKEEEEERVTPP